MLLKKKGKGIP